MKLIKLYGMLAIFFVTGTAQATLVQWDMGVRVDYVIRNTDGLDVTVGDILTGSIIYDTNLPVPQPIGGVATKYTFSGNGTMSLTIGGNTYSRALDEIEIFDNCLRCNYLDRFFAGSVGNIYVDGMQFWIDGGNDGRQQFSNLLTSAALPTDPLDLSLLAPEPYRTATYIFRSSNLDVEGQIVSLNSHVSAIPAPSALILVLTGLGMLVRTKRFTT